MIFGEKSKVWSVEEAVLNLRIPKQQFHGKFKIICSFPLCFTNHLFCNKKKKSQKISIHGNSPLRNWQKIHFPEAKVWVIILDENASNNKLRKGAAPAWVSPQTVAQWLTQGCWLSRTARQEGLSLHTASHEQQK